VLIDQRAPGRVVGEIALLTDRPRIATVRAARDSDLLLLRVSPFTSQAKRQPALLAEMARLVVDRLLTVDRPDGLSPASRTIAVARAGPGPAQSSSQAGGRHPGPTPKDHEYVRDGESA
jgi:CRP-like cAMP-binding protein